MILIAESSPKFSNDCQKIHSSTKTNLHIEAPFFIPPRVQGFIEDSKTLPVLTMAATSTSLTTKVESGSPYQLSSEQVRLLRNLPSCIFRAYNLLDIESFARTLKSYQSRKSLFNIQVQPPRRRRRRRTTRRLHPDMAHLDHKETHSRPKATQTLQARGPSPPQHFLHVNNLPHNRRSSSNLQRNRLLTRLPLCP